MTVTVDDRFAEWMATPPQTGTLVEGLYFFGNPWVGNLRFANAVYDDTTLPDEDLVNRQWQPLSFRLSLPERRSSLQTELGITADGVGPELIAAFDDLPPDYLAIPVQVRLYSWIIPTAQDKPLIRPPPRFVVEDILISTTSIQIDCSGPLLPNWRAGAVYTIEQFPGLSTE